MADERRSLMPHFSRLFTQNQLKVIAAFCMLTDHVGAELFPQLIVLRVIGRLAFPIFSFFIYEGCKYTHDRRKYLTNVLFVGFLCVAGYYIYSGEIYWNVMITFSLSICVLSCVRYCKGQVQKGVREGVQSVLLFLLCVGGIWIFCRYVQVDYGFYGVILPAFAEISDRGQKYGKAMPLLGFGFGLVLLSIQMGGIQYFSLFSLILLAAYNGSRGKRHMKYFFYWFYPAHFLVIGAAALLMA